MSFYVIGLLLLFALPSYLCFVRKKEISNWLIILIWLLNYIISRTITYFIATELFYLQGDMYMPGLLINLLVLWLMEKKLSKKDNFDNQKYSTENTLPAKEFKNNEMDTNPCDNNIIETVDTPQQNECWNRLFHILSYMETKYETTDLHEIQAILQNDDEFCEAEGKLYGFDKETFRKTASLEIENEISRIEQIALREQNLQSLQQLINSEDEQNDSLRATRKYSNLRNYIILAILVAVTMYILFSTGLIPVTNGWRRSHY